MAHVPDRLLQATAVLLVASVALIVPSLAGLGASVPLGLALAVLGGALFALRSSLAAVGPIADVPVGSYLRRAWAGLLVAAAVALYALGATPGELQALGGLCGLAGMLNYFLRPAVVILVAMGQRLERSFGGAGGR